MWSKYILPLCLLSMLGLQCSTDRNDTVVNKCGCDNSPTLKEVENMKAEVIQSPVIESGQPIYALNIKQSDFNKGGQYSVGDNILLPCDSLQEELKERGLGVTISYALKDCSAGLTAPEFRSVFGRLIDLKSIQKGR